MSGNPMSPYAVVELRMQFLVRKGQGSIISMGTLGTDDHAAITGAIDKAMTLHLPEGLVMTGTEITIKDL